MAGPVGIEPTLAVLETDVLPLYEGPMCQNCKQHYNKRGRFWRIFFNFTDKNHHDRLQKT